MSAVKPRRALSSAGDQRGSSLIAVLLLMALLSAIAVGMALVFSVETTVAARFVQGAQAVAAAEGAVHIALAELRPMPDWSPILAGASSSPRSDGAFAGLRILPGGGSVPLCCGPASLSGRLAAENGLSGAFARRSLVWRPFLWAPAAALLPTSPSRLYLVVFVEDDEDDGDGSAMTDLNGRVVVRGEAVQPDGLRRSVEALIERERGDPLRALAPAVRLLRWREVR